MPPPVVPNRTPGPRSEAPRGPAPVWSVAPRSPSVPLNAQVIDLLNGEKAYAVTGGAILTVRNIDPSGGLLDVEADRIIIFLKGDSPDLIKNFRNSEGNKNRDVEFYMAGNVEVRRQSGKDLQTLRAAEVYYDASRNVAVAIKADLELKQPGLPDPVHLKAEELNQLSKDKFRVFRAEVFSSRLPSDPGLKFVVAEGTLEENKVPKRSIFGAQFVNRNTGAAETEKQKLFHGDDVSVKIEDIPVFYLPFLQGDANDPLGPLESLSFNANRLFGFETMTTFNMYQLLGIDPLEGTRWKLYADYLTRRGPALGSEFDYKGKDLFGLTCNYEGLVKGYGIYDGAKDILGGNRGDFESHPKLRGRLLWQQNVQNLPEGFSVQSQFSALSDKNFLEEYYKIEFDQGLNQESYLYVKQQQEN